MNRSNFTPQLDELLNQIKNTLDVKGREYTPPHNIFENFDKAQQLKNV